MNRKRTSWLVIGILGISVFLSLVGCSSGEEKVFAKELIVKNNSSVAIDELIIFQEIVGAKETLGGTSIAAGASKSYFIAPSYGDVDFMTRVSVTFDGTSLAVSGSTAQELEFD